MHVASTAECCVWHSWDVHSTEKILHFCFYTWKQCVSFKVYLFVSSFEDVNFWMAYPWQLLFCCVILSDLRISFNGEIGITGYFHTAVWCLLHCWQPDHWVTCVLYVFQSCPGGQTKQETKLRRGVRNVAEDKRYMRAFQILLEATASVTTLLTASGASCTCLSKRF